MTFIGPISCSRRSIIALGSDAPFVQVGNDPTLFRKELIYKGHFTKKGPDGKIAFEMWVGDPEMDHWVNEFLRMKQASVDVPLALEHTKNPERRRGTVVDIRKEFNPERGDDSLFMYSRFRDAEAAQLAKSSQVSLFAEPAVSDGHGNDYIYPITHVAVTDYPLVSGLGAWQTIACSLGSPGEEPVLLQDENAMTPFQRFCARIGVNCEGMDDQAIEDMLVGLWDNEVLGEGTETEVDPLADPAADPLADPSLEPVMPAASAAPARPAMSGAACQQRPGTMAASVAASMNPLFQLIDGVLTPVALSLAAPQQAAGTPSQPAASAPAAGPPAVALSQNFGTVVSELVSSRASRLEGLVQARVIAPSVRDQYKSKYATPEKVEIALSREGGDGFEDLMIALSQSGATLPGNGEKTPGQFVMQQGQTNPLLRDAESRAKAAK